MNVLFVCTGNVCRSPMAEAFLNSHAEERGLDVVARSTGTHAWTGRAATYDGRRIMAELGTPIDDHRTRRLDPALVEWADLVVTLATEHTREVLRDFPEAEGRVITLKELVGILPKLPGYTDPRSWVAEVDAAKASLPPADDRDVDDPFGERDAAYRRVATEIRDLVRELADGLTDKGVVGRR